MLKQSQKFLDLSSTDEFFNLAYILVLVDNIDSAGLVFAHHFVISPHWSSNDHVIQAVSIKVARGHCVSKVSSNLIPSHIIQIGQVGIV